MIISTLEEFLAHANDFGVARIVFLSDLQKSQMAKNLSNRLGDEFKLAPKSEKNLYCTTLIEQEISKFVKFEPRYSSINLPLMSGECLYPKAFWDYENIQIIYEN